MKKSNKKNFAPIKSTLPDRSDIIYDPDDNLYNSLENDKFEHSVGNRQMKVKSQNDSKYFEKKSFEENT